MLIRQQQSEEQGDTRLSCVDGTSLLLSPAFRKKRRWPLKHGSLSDVQPVPLAVSGVYFLKYLCLISASVTCPVQCAADTLWQCREASGQHRREQATLWIINGINQHLWCGWQFAEAGRLLLALGKLSDQPGRQLSCPAWSQLTYGLHQEHCRSQSHDNSFSPVISTAFKCPLGLLFGLFCFKDSSFQVNFLILN